jgi:endonuclease-3
MSLELIAKMLEQYFDPNINLLEHQDAFQLLISVVLSAQTTDRQVNEVTPELFRHYPDPASMARADIQHLEQLIHSTGFYRNKAKHIKGAAKYIHDELEDQVPEIMDELVKIPGVGRKSAGVVLHHIFDKPAIIVDTHYGRVIMRLGFSNTQDPIKVEKSVASSLDKKYWSSLSMTANLHGRTFCHSRKPLCSLCPLSNHCSWEEKQKYLGIPDSRQIEQLLDSPYLIPDSILKIQEEITSLDQKPNSSEL